MFTRIRKFFHGLREMGHRLEQLDKREEELISKLTPDEATVCLHDIQTEKLRGAKASPGPKDGGPNVRGLAFIVILALVVGGGCGGLGTKTARDIETASDMILPEYLSYVDADVKLKDEQKQDRRNQVRALRDVIRAAQK